MLTRHLWMASCRASQCLCRHRPITHAWLVGNTEIQGARQLCLWGARPQWWTPGPCAACFARQRVRQAQAVRQQQHLLSSKRRFDMAAAPHMHALAMSRPGNKHRRLQSFCLAHSNPLIKGWTKTSLLFLKKKRKYPVKFFEHGWIISHTERLSKHEWSRRWLGYTILLF
jgi:hypothetical protein